jgi:hypothetical protein
VSLIDLPWGFWNGLTAWIVLIAHVFGGWSEFPVFDVARSGNWYELGFLIGAGSPLLGAAGAGTRNCTPKTAQRRARLREPREAA